jgi:hypothetical protein
LKGAGEENRSDSFERRFILLLRAASTVIFAVAGLNPGAAKSETPSPLAEESDVLYRPDVAGTRPRPGFETKGVPIRAAIVSPSLRVSMDYDSNIFNRDGDAGIAKIFPGLLNAKLDKRGDLALRIEPGLKVSSNWSRHLVALNISGRVTRFASLTRENSDEFEAGLQGRFDLGAEEAAFAGIDYSRQVEPRGTGGGSILSLLGARPTLHNDLKAGIGAISKGGRVRLRVAGNAEWRRYAPLEFRVRDIFTQDASAETLRNFFDLPDPFPSSFELDQSLRNSKAFGVVTRADFGATPNASVFLESRLSAVRPLVRPEPGNQIDRSATAATILVGVRFIGNDVFAGEAGIGFERRKFKDIRVPNYAGINFRAKLDWYPTPLLSFRVKATQDFLNSGLLTEAAVLNRAVQLSAYWEALRNLNVIATARVERDKYRQLQWQTTTASFSLRGSYDLGPRMAIGATVGIRNRTSSQPLIINRYIGLSFGISLIGRI